MTKDEFMAKVEERLKYDDPFVIMPAAEWFWDEFLADQRVWTAEASGVYLHGIHLVARTEQEITQFCEKYAPDTDGYHQWVIEEHRVGHLPTKRRPSVEKTPGWPTDGWWKNRRHLPMTPEVDRWEEE